ncbi:hypothetical protein E2C01_001832 [Portunus trituberculatus]|uniref:Uncharacterized protein n=1 Tax=Portunus trituberculatus TaxID=210409 RepID=A0A5B7CIB2_PORTR|nr:hypothetical protein [Portunus trituberculatus]
MGHGWRWHRAASHTLAHYQRYPRIHLFFNSATGPQPGCRLPLANHQHRALLPAAVTPLGHQ